MENKHIEWIPIFGRRIMWNRTLQDCPKFAEKLKLKFHSSKQIEEIGIISGQFKGHTIKIKIDEQRITIGIKSQVKKKLKDLKLTTGKNYYKLTSKDFKFQNKKLNKLFKTRQVSEKLQKAISENKKLEMSLLNFFKKHDNRVGSINIGNDLFFAYYGRGFSDKKFSHRKNSYGMSSSSSMRFFYYIPLDFLENVLPDFIDILKSFEKISQE